MSSDSRSSASARACRRGRRRSPASRSRGPRTRCHRTTGPHRARPRPARTRGPPPARSRGRRGPTPPPSASARPDRRVRARAAGSAAPHRSGRSASRTGRGRRTGTRPCSIARHARRSSAPRGRCRSPPPGGRATPAAPARPARAQPSPRRSRPTRGAARGGRDPHRPPTIASCRTPAWTRGAGNAPRATRTGRPRPWTWPRARRADRARLRHRRHLAGDLLGRREGEAAGEDGEPTQQHLLPGIEQVVAPVHRSEQRPVPAVVEPVGPGQQPEAIVDAPQDLGGRHHGHPGRGELDGERHAVEAAHELRTASSFDGATSKSWHTARARSPNSRTAS